MIRYSIFLIALTSFIAGAVVSAIPDNAAATVSIRNETIIFKNQAFPHLGPLVVEDCAEDDCSDVPERG